MTRSERERLAGRQGGVDDDEERQAEIQQLEQRRLSLRAAYTEALLCAFSQARSVTDDNGPNRLFRLWYRGAGFITNDALSLGALLPPAPGEGKGRTLCRVDALIRAVAAGLDRLLARGQEDYTQLTLSLVGHHSSIGADPVGTPGSEGWKGMLGSATERGRHPG